jgi:hypothetical protein
MTIPEQWAKCGRTEFGQFSAPCTSKKTKWLGGPQASLDNVEKIPDLTEI